LALCSPKRSLATAPCRRPRSSTRCSSPRPTTDEVSKIVANVSAIIGEARCKDIRTDDSSSDVKTKAYVNLQTISLHGKEIPGGIHLPRHWWSLSSERNDDEILKDTEELLAKTRERARLLGLVAGLLRAELGGTGRLLADMDVDTDALRRGIYLLKAAVDVLRTKIKIMEEWLAWYDMASSGSVDDDERGASPVRSSACAL
jgi:hypothetical protein